MDIDRLPLPKLCKRALLPGQVHLSTGLTLLETLLDIANIDGTNGSLTVVVPWIRPPAVGGDKGLKPTFRLVATHQYLDVAVSLAAAMLLMAIDGAPEPYARVQNPTSKAAKLQTCVSDITVLSLKMH